MAMRVLSWTSSMTLMVKAATAIRISKKRISPISAKHELNFDFGGVDTLGDIVGVGLIGMQDLSRLAEPQSNSATLNVVARRRLDVQSGANEGRYTPLPPLNC